MEKNLEKLLTLVKEVCDAHRQYKKGFNVITTFVKPHREVELHSRFITWLLDPKNDYHGLGTLPLELFLNQLNSQFKVSSTTKVVPNASNWTEDREMDILIYDETQNFAIIIENKIYAKDSDKGENNGQLARYYYQIKNGVKIQKEDDVNGDYFRVSNDKNIQLYYLTLDGHTPTNLNFKNITLKKEGKDGNYPSIHSITYLHHIEPWLNEIILSIYNDEKYLPTVELIQQYLDALHCVSPNVKLNQDMFDKMEKNESYIDTLKKLLSDKDWVNLQPEQIEEKLKEKQIDEELWSSAIFLLNNHKHLYWHALNDFFIKLQNILRNEFHDNLLSRHQEGSQKEPPIYQYVNDIIFDDKNASKLSPMYYRIRKANGEEWTLQPNRAKGFFLGLDKKQTENSEAVGWKTEIYLSEFKDEKGQIPLLNLWDFMKGDTFDLLNEEKRQEIAERYAQFVKQELNKL